MIRLVIGLVCMVFTSMLLANSVSFEDYARHAQFTEVKISPSGKYLALSNRADDGNMQVVVLDRLAMKLLSKTHFSGADTINNFYWANDERLILTMAREIGALESSQPTGELYAVNADGRRGLMLTGFRSQEKQYTVSEVIDFLPDDDKHIIISSRNLRSREPFIEFYRLNIDTGRKRKVGQAPIRAIQGSNIYTVTDANGVPRMVMGVDPNKETDTILMYKPTANAEWQEFGRYSEQSERRFIPLAFSPDNSKIFGLSDLETDTQAIVAVDLASKKTEILAHHPLTNVMPIFSLSQGVLADVIGAGYEYETLEAIFFDNAADSAFGQAIKGLIAAFPNTSVSITSTTKDDTLAVVRVQSANQDPAFYFFDMKNSQLTYLLNQRPWLKDKALPETKIVFYTARDGQKIRGLLTLPQGKAAEDLPLVVFPHGGPIGPRDSYADFNTYTMYMKVLADNGYAVLQPNFRGSGGYGLAFQQAGYRNWGTVMIDDMTDGVMSLAEQGIVDKNRVCTFGASYGGYAAVQTAIREPDLYKCSIAYVGLFDLEMLYTEGDVPETAAGLRYIERIAGKDPELLKAQSPLRNLEKLKAPVFIVHGAEDRRTPISHANALREALEKRNHPYEWLVKEKEGHGFVKPEHNVELWQKSVDFLNRHIGKPAP